MSILIKLHLLALPQISLPLDPVTFRSVLLDKFFPLAKYLLQKLSHYKILSSCCDITKHTKFHELHSKW